MGDLDGLSMIGLQGSSVPSIQLIVHLHLARIKSLRSENHDLNCAGPCLHLP